MRRPIVREADWRGALDDQDADPEERMHRAARPGEHRELAEGDKLNISCVRWSRLARAASAIRWHQTATLSVGGFCAGATRSNLLTRAIAAGSAIRSGMPWRSVERRTKAAMSLIAR